MRLYELDKVLHEIVVKRDARDRFLADPAAALAPFDLSDEARTALIERRYGVLYCIGAHPFLLWGWAARINHSAVTPAFVEEYCRQIVQARGTMSPLAVPDYAT